MTERDGLEEPGEPGHYPSPPPDAPAPPGIPESALYPADSSRFPAVYDPPAAYDPPLGTIGDITITRSQVITPHGAWQLQGSTWAFTDLSRTEEHIPAVAIVLAIIFFLFCLLGLLFLLMKSTRTVGWVQVTVSGSGRQHSTMIPAHSPSDVLNVVQQVNWARSMSAWAGSDGA